MMNGNEDDDIDLFIISSAERIWTARFFALILAQMLKLRGKYNEQYQQGEVNGLSSCYGCSWSTSSC